jgi:hypothetical protein
MTDVSSFRPILNEVDLGLLDVAFEHSELAGAEIPETVLIAVGTIVRAHRMQAADEAGSLVRAELEPPLDRVRRLHSQNEDSILAPGRWCPACGHETPCPTTRALNGAL